MVANETFMLLTAVCQDIFKSCYQQGLTAGVTVGIILGFVFFAAFWMMIRKEFMKENYHEKK